MNCLSITARVCPLVILSAALAGGCKPAVETAPVSGKVAVDGQPVASGQVSYLPEDEKAAGGLSAGTIGADGAYKIFTAGKEGAPPGKYKVTVTPSMVPPAGAGAPPAAPFNAKYANVQTTPLEIEVVSSPEPGRYDLKLTK